MPYQRIYFASQFFCGLVFKIFSLISKLTFGYFLFRLEVDGQDNIRNLTGPFIVTSNHKSYADGFFILAAVIGTNRKMLPVRPTIADWVLNIPYLGWILKNIFGANPANKGKGLDVSLQPQLEILQKNHPVVIFPEGKLRTEPGIYEFKVGAAYLAQRSGAPILPVSIQGAEYLSLRSFLFGRKRVRVLFGQPFYVSCEQDLNTSKEEIKSRITNLYYQTA